ncbi:hypothetical protein [Halapricum desulfuricans]|uniref:Arylsulfatase A or related enzyme n=1 Tax=Halapricum desulfuricans TaxID=2841257 RepID=A0A897NW49_9EURY|nr:hypothetical protein [Halapricum desulfuricans]QSG14973.1 Arylsulfatase A or related enzyme [Halapricum desulfuricans]
MSFQEFLDKSKMRYEMRGTAALSPIIKDFTLSAFARVTERVPSLADGAHVFDREWDVLVILDACRHDMYERRVQKCQSIWSVAGSSAEWMRKTFNEASPEVLKNTAYVTSNPFSERSDALEGIELGLLDEVWRDGWDEELGTVPARPVTDHGIAAARRNEFDRVIVHYMQPHYPFIGDLDEGETPIGMMDQETFGEVGDELGLWDRVLLGELPTETVLDAYDANLDYVMDDVELLLENVDGKVVVSADHGNALGEWGQWGHRPSIPHPGMRRVPWDVRECTDEETYQPEIGPTDQSEDDVNDVVSDRLQKLGYMDE